MRIIVLSLILFCYGTCPITAQSDYIVTTPSTQEIPVGEGTNINFIPGVHLHSAV